MQKLGIAAWVLGITLYLGWLGVSVTRERVTTIASRVDGDCSAPRGQNEWVQMNMALNPETGKLEVLCQRYLGHRPMPSRRS